MKDGKASGVIAETPNGKMTINAKAVIIATGGFSANEDLYTKYRPELKGFITTGHPGGTGDGIFMAEAIGATLVDMEQIQIHPTVEQSKSELVTEGLRGRGAILVNQEGKRFGDEMGTRDVVSADDLKLHYSQFQIIGTKRKICAFTILAQMLPFVFFFAPVSNCIFTVWVPTCEENMGCP